MIVDIVLSVVIGVGIIVAIAGFIYLWITAMERYPLVAPLSLLVILLGAAYSFGYLVLGALRGQW